MNSVELGAQYIASDISVGSTLYTNLIVMIFNLSNATLYEIFKLLQWKQNAWALEHAH